MANRLAKPVSHRSQHTQSSLAFSKGITHLQEDLFECIIAMLVDMQVKLSSLPNTCVMHV